MAKEQKFIVERVQTGVRMEKRLLKVLKAVAELKDMSLGDLLEGIVLHAFEGKPPFLDEMVDRCSMSAQLRHPTFQGERLRPAAQPAPDRDDDAGAPLGAPEAIVQQANSESPH